MEQASNYGDEHQYLRIKWPLSITWIQMTNNVIEYHKHDMNEITTIMKQCTDPKQHTSISNKVKNTNSQTMNNHQDKANP